MQAAGDLARLNRIREGMEAAFARWIEADACALFGERGSAEKDQWVTAMRSALRPGVQE